MTYTHACIDCEKDYESESKWAGFCPRCNRTILAQNRGDIGRKATGFTHDMLRKGASRQAMRILKDEKAKETK